MDINVSSEIGHLSAVVVHTPGSEVSLVNPELKDELLFDDIIFEEDAKEEHLDMLDVFKSAMPEDGEVIEFLDLFIDSLQIADARKYFIDQLISLFPEENLKIVEKELFKLSPNELLELSTSGTVSNSKIFSLNPSPNLLFTRDLAAVVGSHILLSRAATKTRLRESLMMETVVGFHPAFKNSKASAIRISGNQSIEGGDVLVESEKLVLIGMSERTSFAGLMKATEGLLKSGVKTVLAIDIPKQRSSMHLDTIFTIVSQNECVVFPPAIMEQKDNVVALQRDGDKILSEPRSSLLSALNEFSGKDYNFIKCGGENRTTQFREQWTDGANLFALAPGVVIGYERNTQTFKALQEQGYTLMNQFDFVEEYEDKNFKPSPKNKIAISFQGHELCRGRGGARCMTMPLSRLTVPK